MFEDLIRRTLGDLPTDVRRRLILGLEDLGKEFLVPKVADTVGRVVVKSIDGVAKAAVKSLATEEDAARLASAYLVEVTDQLSQFAEALDAYLPHALAVEVAKKAHGDKSAQANAARRERERWMNEAKSEVRDVFRAIAGQEAAD